MSTLVKATIGRLLSSEQKQLLRRLFDYHLKSRLFAGNLTELAKIYWTDKFGTHTYTPFYQGHFYGLRKKKLKVLEIGIGGYDDPCKGGGSLKMWKRFFPKSMIYGIDLYDKTPLQEKRVVTFAGSQNDTEFLKKVHDNAGPFDLIIDDGSHINEHVLTTFKVLFPYLSSGGIYVVEDTQTSYWKEYGGDSDNFNNMSTIMAFFKSLVDCLNYTEFEKKNYHPTYYDKNILSIHFYHNMVFVYKR
ncbi:MAG: class I SAM-dependent methyltransferase [Candidatus Auribacterota bacterium]